jgi:hypothetical protein
LNAANVAPLFLNTDSAVIQDFFLLLNDQLNSILSIQFLNFILWVVWLIQSRSSNWILTTQNKWYDITTLRNQKQHMLIYRTFIPFIKALFQPTNRKHQQFYITDDVKIITTKYLLHMQQKVTNLIWNALAAL